MGCEKYHKTHGTPSTSPYNDAAQKANDAAHTHCFRSHYLVEVTSFAFTHSLQTWLLIVRKLLDFLLTLTLTICILPLNLLFFFCLLHK